MNKAEFSKLLSQKIVMLDGAMGTMLQEIMEIGQKPELLNIDSPQTIIDIHTKYLNAGADIIFTNTFGANSYKMGDYDYKKVIICAIDCAKKAVQSCERGLIAYDMGSIGQLMQPMGSLSFDEAYSIFQEQVELSKDSVDLYVLETMSDLYEVKAGVLAIKESCNKPIIVTMSFDESGRTFSGCPVEVMAEVMYGLGVDAIGMNCSVGPKQAQSIVDKLISCSKLPIVCKPNAGIPLIKDGHMHYDIDKYQFVDVMTQFIAKGVSIVGGCCGTNDQYISLLAKAVKDKKSSPRQEPKYKGCVTSGTRYIQLNEPKVVGERINPTGKKIMKEAILNKNIDYFKTQAVEQIQAGAEILDINMGVPNIDEPQMMKMAVEAVQSIVDYPLQIDSSDKNAIEIGLRYAIGKCIVNSVNADDEVLDSILPIVKKYGACVVGLTLDKQGIPKTVDQRLSLAKKIVDKALEYGIDRQDIIIDCLTLTAGAEQEQASYTLEALRRVKQELGVKTTLGVSNISFGLPNRFLLNKSFLIMALTCGLDLPIINPNIEQMQEAVYTYRLLANYDKGGVNYINKYSQTQETTNIKQDNKTLHDYIMQGLVQGAKDYTKELLKDNDGLSIIENFVAPSLDYIGDSYEKGTLFLPQLISSSEVAKAVCDVVKESMSSQSIGNKCKIVIATVQGDVHDIGKNIVKTVLQNYGYDIVDLGRDVAIESVVEAVKKHNPQVLALSALMTTTVVNMKKTIQEVSKLDSKPIICVGGAVLTEEVAQEIGADCYSKDPQQLVKYLSAKGL